MHNLEMAERGCPEPVYISCATISGGTDEETIEIRPCLDFEDKRYVFSRTSDKLIRIMYLPRPVPP